MTGYVWIPGASALLVAGAAAMLRYLRRRYVEVTVDGTSMVPTYQPGDRVLVRRTGLDRLRVGDVAVIHRPDPADPQAPSPSERDRRRGSLLIKRVAALPGEPVPPTLAAVLGGDTAVPVGQLVVLGDAGERSYDPKHFGYVPADGLLGVAVRRRPRAPGTGQDPEQREHGQGPGT